VDLIVLVAWSDCVPFALFVVTGSRRCFDVMQRDEAILEVGA